MQQLQITGVPTQRLQVTLGGQPCSIELRWNGRALYLSLWQRDTAILLTKICRAGQLLLTGARYRGFSGDLLFVDTQGTSDPRWSGLGARFVLIYLAASEAP